MRCISFLLLSLFSLPLLAKVDVDIFHAEVILTQDKNAQNLAFQKGLEQVLIKATAQADIHQQAAIKKALPQSADYVSQFRNDTLNGQPSMVIDFNPNQVQTLIQQSNIPYWPALRENILVWLIEENGEAREIGWETFPLPTTDLLMKASVQAGLPITLPIGDIEDLNVISTSDLWGKFTTQIAKASQRYSADAVLLIKITGAAEAPQMEWELYDSEPDQLATASITLSGTQTGEKEKSITQMMSEMASYYANKNAQQHNTQVNNRVLVHFDDMTDMSDLVVRERQLKGLNSVTSVQLHSFQGNKVTFSLGLVSSIEDFKKEIHRLKALALVPSPSYVTPDVQQVEVPSASEPSIPELWLEGK